MGQPIPIIYCDSCGIVPVLYKDLPVLLPENIEISSSGGSPLSVYLEFVNTKYPKCNGKAKGETNMIDRLMCSSWYFLRYTNPFEEYKPFEPEELNYWMPVDQYISGLGIDCFLHLLYSRFLSHFLYDLGIIPINEPFNNLLNQGMVRKNGKPMSKLKE